MYPVRPNEIDSEEEIDREVKRPRVERGDEGLEGAAVEGEARAREGTDEHRESQEAQPSKGIYIPIAPSAAQKAEHERTHLPFRAWCDICVKARGLDRGHSSEAAPTDRYRIPQLELDYWFMGGESSMDKEGIPIIVMYEKTRQVLLAHKVNAKGADVHIHGCLEFRFCDS